MKKLSRIEFGQFFPSVLFLFRRIFNMFYYSRDEHGKNIRFVKDIFEKDKT